MIRVVHYWKDCLNASPDVSTPDAFGFAFDPVRRQYTWIDILRNQAKTPAAATADQAEVIDPIVKPSVHPQKQLENLQEAARMIGLILQSPLQSSGSACEVDDL